MDLQVRWQHREEQSDELVATCIFVINNYGSADSVGSALEVWLGETAAVCRSRFDVDEAP